MSEFVRKYKHRWDVGTYPHPAMIELAAMNQKLDPSQGGLGMHGHLKNAMQMLWPATYGGEIEPGVLRWRDELELLTWAFCTHRTVAVIGHASAGKTHTFGHIAAAMYLADAQNTIITLTSTHLQGLRKRLWSDTVSACKSHTLVKLFGSLLDFRNHDMTIRPFGTKEDKYVIEGIATDKGADAVERIQGNHSRNHRLVIVDEAQGTPEAIFEASANLMSDPDFRMALLANPTGKHTPFGSWCEPKDGWNKVDPDIDLWWETKRGGVCVRLDGLKSPNVVHRKTIFPFLIKQSYLDSVEQAFGKDSPRWWTFVRGWFAPDGSMGLVYPSSVLAKADKKFEYQMPPTKIAALDPAFEGGDQCALAIAEYGEANGSRFAMNLLRVEDVKVAVSSKSEPLDVLIAKEVIRICKAEGIKPQNLIIDVTGAGRGVAAIIQTHWKENDVVNVERCQFGSGPTDRKIKQSDLDVAKDMVDRFVSEMWWSGRAWMEEGLVGGIDETFRTLREQLSARQYETIKDKKISIETKKEMKDRLGYSPDQADAYVMLIELIRRRGAVAGTVSGKSVGDPDTRLNRRAILYSRMEDAVEASKQGNIQLIEG